MGEFDFEKLDREVDDLLADVKGLLDEPEEDEAELDDLEEDETEPEDAEDDAEAGEAEDAVSDDGESLFPELKRSLGFVSANSIADVLAQHGYPAKACRGSIDALKQRLAEGAPIIVFIRIPGDTHYAVAVGYDERHLYLADSLAKNANASDARYNRVLTTEAFEALWNTGALLPANIYIRAAIPA